MFSPMFIESNNQYAIQLNRGGSSQPYHVALSPSSFPEVSPAQKTQLRYCGSVTRDPVACVKQTVSQLPIPASTLWPRSHSSTWTPSTREEYTKEPLRGWIGEFQKNRLLDPGAWPQIS